jgi:elongation factor Ts
MAQISAALVKALRERTGSGMMECKKALEETAGDLEAAVELMRKTGLAKADRKAGRIAAEGTIVICSAADGKAIAMVEVNCETDFVAKGEAFQRFARQVAEQVLNAHPADLDALLALPLEGDKSVEQVRRELVARLGENINVRRFTCLSSATGLLNSYLHGGRIGVVVELAGGDLPLARDIAMHVAASRPLCVRADQLPPERLAKEREIYTAQAATTGKPAPVIEKIVEGQLQKYIAEVTLLGQPFVKDLERSKRRSIEQLLTSAGATVTGFQRFELGEGIEKKADNFAAEVMAQMQRERDGPDDRPSQS